jgi:hypothetical protein
MSDMVAEEKHAMLVRQKKGTDPRNEPVPSVPVSTLSLLRKT